MKCIKDMLDFGNADASFANTKDAQEQWVSLAMLLKRPYFTRRWIVQEVAFAKKATVHFGSETVDWVDLADAAVLLESHWPTLVSQLSRNEQDDIGEISAPGAKGLIQLTNHFLRKDHYGRIQGRLVDLEALLTMLPMFNTTLQHDTVYSIMSLARDSYQGKSLPLDYNMDPRDLFAKAVEIIISTEGNLDIVCRPWAPSVKFRQPSWIGQSDKYPFFKPKIIRYARRDGDSLVRLPGKRVYYASRDTSCQSREVNFYRQPRKYWSLRVQGFGLGAISTAYQKSQNGNIPDDWLSFKRPAYGTTATSYGVSMWATQSVAAEIRRTRIREVLWRTVFADRTKDGQTAPRWYIRACDSCLSKKGEHWGQQAVDLEKLLNFSSERLKEVLGRIRETIWSRRLFQYQHSDLASVHPCDPHDAAAKFSLGLGPGDLREGDIVVVLFGCSVPVILRNVSAIPNLSLGKDTYELVGEAYIHGMMDGEALEKGEDGTYVRPEKSFEIV